jgi:hypothetical protein
MLPVMRSNTILATPFEVARHVLGAVVAVQVNGFVLPQEDWPEDVTQDGLIKRITDDSEEGLAFDSQMARMMFELGVRKVFRRQRIVPGNARCVGGDTQSLSVGWQCSRCPWRLSRASS